MIEESSLVPLFEVYGNVSNVKCDISRFMAYISFYDILYMVLTKVVLIICTNGFKIIPKKLVLDSDTNKAHKETSRQWS